MEPHILLASGNFFNFMTPDQSEYTVEDIANNLSHICRFTGSCEQFYSVAQHSVLVSRIVPREHALAALMHDASEAFLGDVSSPLKQLLSEYKVIEQRVEEAIFSRYGLPFPMHPEIKAADLRALKTEFRDVMKVDETLPLLRGILPWPTTVHPMSPKRAKTMFLNRFDELT